MQTSNKNNNYNKNRRENFREELSSLSTFLLQLAIKAQDLGSPPLSSEETITIELENIDDNIPVFVKVWNHA